MTNLLRSAEPRLITGEEFALMPDTDGCELIRGKVGPQKPIRSTELASVLGNVTFELCRYTRHHHLGVVLTGGSGIYTQRDPDTVRGVDVLQLSHARYTQRDQTLAYLNVAPELIAEILSPSHCPGEMAEKIAEYFEIGVSLVWVVDPKHQCVHAYRSPTEMTTYNMGQDLPGEDALPGFSVPVSRFFA